MGLRRGVRSVGAAVTDIVPPPSPSDILLGRVIVVLGLLGAIALLGTILLAWQDKSIPDVLNVVLGGTVTGLGAVLAGRKT